MMMDFNYYSIIACILLGLFLFFKEVKRNNKSMLIWRLFASLLMVVSFTFLLIPITYQVKKEETAGELNLITEGVQADTLSAIKAQKFTLDPAIAQSGKTSTVKYIADLAYYLQENPFLKKVNIYGYGLSAEELSMLNSLYVNFYPSNHPSGINAASWPKKIKTTENLKVQGVYHHSGTQNIKLKLYGMGSTLDSISIKANTTNNFSFQTQPKQIGKAVYQLIALQGKDTLAVAQVPFEVEAQQKLNVLVLASFPDFEYKFLKKWLYENEYPVIFRSQISKDKYSSDFLNTKAIAINQIHTSLLKNIAVLMIDEDEYAAISGTERAAIDAAVSGGMGLVLRITNAKPNSNSQRFKRIEISSPNAKTLRVHGLESNYQFAELPFAQTLFLEPVNSEQPLFKAANNSTIVNTSIKGMGKIVVSSVASTYQWQLAGKHEDYAQFWSTIINKSSRKTVAHYSFEIIPSFLTVGEKARLVVDVDDAKLPDIQFNSIPLAPKQNMELPFKWDGIFWPIAKGWQKIAINQKIENVFVFSDADWKSLKNTKKINATANFVAKQTSIPFKMEKIAYVVTEELSKWWFFAVFLIAAAFLWYEQRFLSNKS